MFVVVVELRVRAGRHEEFVDAVAANRVASLRDEPGCRRFDVVQDTSDPAHWFLYELYVDEAALEAHRATPHFDRWRQAAARCLAEAGGQCNSYCIDPFEVDRGGGEQAQLLVPRLLRTADRPVIDRGGGVRTVAMVDGREGATQFLSGTTELPPGASLPFHSHNCEESVVVLDGIAAFECGSESTDMHPGDSSWVPAGVVHRFANRSDSGVRILWIYGRADADRTLAETGETFPVELAQETRDRP